MKFNEIPQLLSQLGFSDELINQIINETLDFGGDEPNLGNEKISEGFLVNQNPPDSDRYLIHKTDVPINLVINESSK